MARLESRDLEEAVCAAEEAWDVIVGELQTNGFTPHAREMLSMMRSQHMGAIRILAGATAAVSAANETAGRVVQQGLHVVR